MAPSRSVSRAACQSRWALAASDRSSAVGGGNVGRTDSFFGKIVADQVGQATVDRDDLVRRPGQGAQKKNLPTGHWEEAPSRGCGSGRWFQESALSCLSAVGPQPAAQAEAFKRWIGKGHVFSRGLPGLLIRVAGYLFRKDRPEDGAPVFALIHISSSGIDCLPLLRFNNQVYPIAVCRCGPLWAGHLAPFTHSYEKTSWSNRNFGWRVFVWVPLSRAPKLNYLKLF